jgi:hypothetical protein
MPTSSPLVECRRWPKRRESKAPAGDELAGALGHFHTAQGYEAVRTQLRFFVMMKTVLRPHLEERAEHCRNVGLACSTRVARHSGLSSSPPS